MTIWARRPALARPRAIRRRRGDHGIAGAARQLLADVADHLEPAWYIIERLGDVVADPAQGAAAAWAGVRRGMNPILARQVVGQRPTRWLRVVDGRVDRCPDDWRGGSKPLRLIGFQRRDCQLELIGFALQLLRGAAELGPPIAGQLEAQLGDLGLGINCISSNLT
jgi:hypothetical protein